LPDAASNPGPTPPSQPDPQGKPRRSRIIAAGLLLLALALVVIYTSHSAFYSPLALVVVAAIGIAALLLQLRLRKDLSAQGTRVSGEASGEAGREAGREVSNEVRAPLWLNILGLVFAIAAVSADVFHASANLMLVAALGSVVCFAVSGTTILRALRKKRS
jgi:hypothetical protein